MNWEYKTFYWDSVSDGVLNKLGAEGWELCAFKQASHPWSSAYTFKRPVVGKSENQKSA